MKTKQLANVLIKILGLSECVQSVIYIFGMIINTIENHFAASFPWVIFLTGAIHAAIGIFFIVKSRDVAGFLFKNEDE